MIIISFMSPDVPKAPASSRPPRKPAVALPRRIRSRELFGAGREVRIDHEGVEYRLTHTRQGKLILTK
jgi:hemin uptake protein HemP